MKWAALLLGLGGPIAVRVMIALGFSAVTFTGVTVTANTLIQYAQTNWSGISIDVLQLASLSGIPEFLGMVMGAYVVRLAMWAVVSASRYMFTPS